MTKQSLQKLIVECLREYAADNAKPVKENRMTLKKSELKALVNEVVRQCIKEGGPQYKVRNGTFQGTSTKDVHSREIQGEPTVNEEFPPAEDQGAEFGGGEDQGTEIGGGEEHSYDESEEIRLLKGMGMIVLKLLKMHQGEDEGEIEGKPTADDGVPFKGPEAGGDESAEEPEGDVSPGFPPKKKEKKEDEDEPVDENFQVQARSFKTVKDAEGNHPERTRKPTTPQ